MTQLECATVAAALRVTLRHLAWTIVDGCIALGACYGGGYALYAGYRRTSASTGGRRLRNAVLLDEAHRGIADIEAFLAAQFPTDTPRRPGTR
jgi:hypothetical protein